MTTRQLYEQIGGNYSEAKHRFLDDSRIVKFAKMFPNDTSYRDLMEAMGDEDCEKAFRAAHTLKGVCLNLNFDRLLESVSIITELLRSCDLAAAKEILPKVTEDYSVTVAAIKAF